VRPASSASRALVVVGMLCLPAIGHGATYFVGKSGCSGSGGTSAQPLCSIGQGIQRLQPGDTLLIQSGSWSEQLRVTRSGTAGKRIVIAAAPGATPVIDGSGLDLWDEGLISIAGCGYVTIRGLTLRKAPYWAMQISTTTGVVIDGNIIESSEHGGIIVDHGSVGTAVINNDVGYTNQCGIGCGIHEAITLSGVGSFIVAGNYVHHGAKEGIDAKDASESGQIYSNTVAYMGGVGIYLNHCRQVKIFDNRVHHNGYSGMQLAVGDYATGLAATTDNSIYKNIFWSNGFCGVQFWSDGAGDLGRNKIYNNVMYQNKHYGLQLSDETGQVRDTIVRNNIIVGNGLGGIAGAAKSASSISNNLFYKTGETAGSDMVTGDPLFVAPPTDFHLQPGSPAIDRGFDMGLVAVGKPDIGAFEYGLATKPDAGPTPKLEAGVPIGSEMGVSLPDATWIPSWDGPFIPQQTIQGSCGCDLAARPGPTLLLVAAAAMIALLAMRRHRRSQDQ
jgi:hypothetical protein